MIHTSQVARDLCVFNVVSVCSKELEPKSLSMIKFGKCGLTMIPRSSFVGFLLKFK